MCTLCTYDGNAQHGDKKNVTFRMKNILEFTPIQTNLESFHDNFHKSTKLNLVLYLHFKIEKFQVLSIYYNCKLHF